MTNLLTEDRVLVSIICTSYNQFEYLKFAIKSILEQSYPHIELIIVDDASTEGSFDEQCLIGFIDQNNYFKVPYKLIINEVNIGHTSSLNKGLNCLGLVSISYM
jgi:glycosyltransferase involved in cell wall biosynthesis